MVPLEMEDLNLPWLDKVPWPAAQSDIVRLHLLADYGGVWADATCACMRPLDEWLPPYMESSDFWMYHGRDGGTGPCSWFMIARKGSYIARRWCDECDKFWKEVGNPSWEYFWMDRLFKELLESDSRFKAEWDKVPYLYCEDPGSSHMLQERVHLDDPHLREILRTNPPHVVKLTRGTPLGENGKEALGIPAAGESGYLLLGFGKSFIDDAADLVESLRANRDLRCVDIVVRPEDVLYARRLGIFSHVHHYEVTADDLHPLCGTSFEKNCLLPRLRMQRFLRFDHTIVLDTDILNASPAEALWRRLEQTGQPIVMLGSRDNPSWHWGEWEGIALKLGIPCVETHGGLFYLNNSDPKALEAVFSLATQAFIEYDKMGMIRQYQEGAVDEPCFAYAFGKLGLWPLEFGEFPAMTFNIQATEPLPTYKMTEECQKRVFDSPIPFIHFFGKNHCPEFIRAKNVICHLE